MGGGRVVGTLVVAVALMAAPACSSSSDDDGGRGGDGGGSGAATAPTGRFGIPAGETPEGLRLCAVEGPATVPEPVVPQAALYGEVGREDPYAGPMLGVLWGPPESLDPAGDGPPVPVAVRGSSGVAAPITVSPQTVLPELGTVVAWEEAGLAVGLYGRSWPAARIPELVALADALSFRDGLFQLLDGVLPEGYGLVHLGSAASLPLLEPLASEYTLRYATAAGGAVTLHGLEGTAEEFEAFRFLTLGLAEADVHGVEMLTGDAWGSTGPAVAAWREPDGRSVRIVGVAIELPVVVELAQFTRQLTPDEWATLASSTTSCPDG